MAVNLCSLLLFVWALGTGLFLARLNPLENDESYTQLSSIQGLSFSDIALGKVDEGNNSPLFYTLQKAFLTASGFRLTERFEPERNICSPNAQVLMRLLPVVFMSLAITALFYFFAARWGLGFGALALCLSLTSPMIWLYWAQARPYSLWVLLCVMQLLLYLDVTTDIRRRNLNWLVAVHVLLCLTSAFGIIQALTVTAFLRQKTFWLAVVPAALGAFYALHAPHYLFRVPLPPSSLIYDNVAIERLAWIALCVFLVRSSNHLYSITGLLLTVPMMIIAYYMAKNVPGLVGFELSSRYFIFLTPLAVVLSLQCLYECWQRYRSGWAKMYLLQIMAGLLIAGGIKTYVALQRLL